jgi:uncharacterized protein (TIGR01777 family)
MRIVVSGASGLIGSALVPALRADGHEVLRLVRRTPRASDEVQWDPASRTLDPGDLAGVQAAVHLAGAGVGARRWSASYKRVIRDSRVDGTTTLATALAALDPLPSVFVSGSAIGYYGDTAGRVATEDTPSGSTFLAGVVRDWEAAVLPAERAGIRVVLARSGLVMSPKGGAFGRLLLPVKLGAGGPLGSGRQGWSWITLEDEVRALQFLLARDDLSGPFNLSAPMPASNRDITKALASAVHRPALVPVPRVALRVVLGDFADELLIDQQAVPRRLLDAGFAFTHPDLQSAVRATTTKAR